MFHSRAENFHSCVHGHIAQRLSQLQRLPLRLQQRILVESQRNYWGYDTMLDLHTCRNDQGIPSLAHWGFRIALGLVAAVDGTRMSLPGFGSFAVLQNLVGPKDRRLHPCIGNFAGAHTLHQEQRLPWVEHLKPLASRTAYRHRIPTTLQIFHPRNACDVSLHSRISARQWLQHQPHFQSQYRL